MNDMLATIIPKSDQLNSDDLIGRSITIKVERVTITPGTEQPVSIHFAGDNGKPYRPCKSMCRVLVQTWGPDANAYVGRGMTLYRDATVTWGGLAVGGIRISHLSHLESAMTMALTATKQSRKPFTVKPMPADAKPTVTLADWIATTLPDRLASCQTPADLDKITASKQFLAALDKADADQDAEMARLVDAARTRVHAATDNDATADADVLIQAMRDAPDAMKWLKGADIARQMAQLQERAPAEYDRVQAAVAARGAA